MVRRAAPVLLAMAFVAAPARADTLGLVTTWGSTGTSAGHFANLYDVAVSPDEHVYTVEDGGGAANRVQRFDSLGAYFAQFGSAGAGPGQFQDAFSLSVADDGVVFVADGFNDRVTRLRADLSGLLGSPWGVSGTGPGQFRNPEGIAVDGTDVVFVADRGNSQIDRYTGAGAPVVEFGGPGTANNQFTRLVDVATDSVGNVYGVDRDRDQVTEFTATGTLVRRWGLGTGTGPGQLRGPQDAAIDAAGNVWIADTPNRRIERYDSTGDFVASYDRVGSLTISPQAIAFGPSGDLYIADQQSARVVRARVGAQGGGAAPVAGKTGNASVVSGTVLVKLPGAGKFVPLTAATAVPVGSELDTTRGTLKLTVALRRSSGTGSANLSGGRFRFTQPLKGGVSVDEVCRRSGVAKTTIYRHWPSRESLLLDTCSQLSTRPPVPDTGKLRTDLSLKGGSFKGCPRPGKGGSARRRTIRYLNAKAMGKFNVIGRHSAGVERGTTWTTKDTCTATTTSVKAGSVAVRDFARRKTIILRAGRTYVARARRR